MKQSDLSDIMKKAHEGLVEAIEGFSDSQHFSVVALKSQLRDSMKETLQELEEAQGSIRVMDKKEYVEALKNLEKQLAEEAE